jgi:hypothetical protein
MLSLAAAGHLNDGTVRVSSEDMSVELRLSPTSIDTRRNLHRTRTNLESETCGPSETILRLRYMDSTLPSPYQLARGVPDT